MEKIVIASTNQGKLKEISQALKGIVPEVICLDQFSNIEEIEETGNTFQENARLKAKTVAEKTGLPALGDDSGLCIKELNGEPGLFSARYSGKHGDHEANIQKVWHELYQKGAKDPWLSEAYFVCTLAMYIPSTKEWIEVEGRVNGLILNEKKGDQGFGYDPIFYYPELKSTFAEISIAEKQRIGHRGKAISELKKQLLKIS